MPGVTVPGMPAACKDAKLPTAFMSAGALVQLPAMCMAAPPSDACTVMADTDWWSPSNLTRGIGRWQVPFGLPDQGAMTVEQCCGLCVADAHCEAASLDPTNQTCKLMSGIASSHTALGFTGVRPPAN